MLKSYQKKNALKIRRICFSQAMEQQSIWVTEAITAVYLDLAMQCSWYIENALIWGVIVNEAGQALNIKNLFKKKKLESVTWRYISCVHSV